MKRPSTHEIVFRQQFPSPKQNEAQNFYAHVQRNLVPEVRVEVNNFYGALDSLEAQYPGLDYTFEGHRRRLSRFPWHRRLFRTFDQLRLTNDEILSICQWEGTKSAKEKYEAETGRIIRDTTLDGVAPIQRSEPAAMLNHVPQRQPSTETMPHAGVLDEHIPEIEQSDNDDIGESVGAQLNDQLMAVDEGDSPIEGPLEEWLKYMHEREVDRDSVLQAIRAGHPPPTALLNVGATVRLSSTGETVASLSSNMAVTPQRQSMSVMNSTRGTISPISSNMFDSHLQIVPITPQHGYGPTSEEVLATLQDRGLQAA